MPVPGAFPKATGHTRDNLAVADGADRDVQVFDAERRQGTLLTVYDVAPEFDRYWDRARGVYVGIEDRLRELLAANDLPGIRLLFNGQEVKPMFSRRGGSRVSVEGSWGTGTTATVKAYRRAPGIGAGATGFASVACTSSRLRPSATG
jgi:hypothetical protein